jgi:NADH:ubiquinone oxidoreductase subunit K
MDQTSQFIFNKKNYIIFIVSLLVICVGFILMIGGESINNVDFNPEIFSFRRITIAPITIIIGYIGIILAIFYND